MTAPAGATLFERAAEVLDDVADEIGRAGQEQYTADAAALRALAQAVTGVTPAGLRHVAAECAAIGGMLHEAVGGGPGPFGQVAALLRAIAGEVAA